MSRQATHVRMPQVGILTLLAVAEFVLTLDLSIVNVALPAIRTDLGFEAGSLQWVVNGYALTFGGFLLLGGRAADLLGGRRVFCCALAVFSLASLACACAPGPGALVAARVVQGIGAGVLAPTTLSILTATYPAPQQRSRALSIWTAVAVGGGAVGGLVGGVLTAALSWRWIFLVNAPVGAALLAYALARLCRGYGEKSGAGRERLDVAGAVTATAGLTALVWALIRVEAAGWASAQVLGGLAAAAALLAAFVVVETRLAREPLIPFSVFASRLVSAGNLLSFLSFVPVLATWYLLSIYLQGVRGYSPVAAGLWFLPMSLAVVGGSQVSFRLVARVDARVLFAAGALASAAGLGWLGRLSADTAAVWVIVPATVTMIGGGLMFAPITVAATSGVGTAQGGLASGLLNTSRQLGGALGLAVLGALATANTSAGSAEQAATSAGAAAAFTAGAAVFLVTAVIGVLMLPARLTPSAGAGSHAGGQSPVRRGRPGSASVRREAPVCAETCARPPGSVSGFAWRGNRLVGRHALPVLALATAIGGLGLAAGGTAGALLGAEMISPAGAGLPLGALVLGSAVAAPAISRHSVRAGRGPALAVGYLAGAAGAALVVGAATAHSVTALLVGSWLLGSANSAVFLTRYAAAELGGAAARGYALGVALAATAVGAIASPNLLGPGGRLAAALGLPASTGLYLVATAAFSLAASLLAMLCRARPADGERAGSADSRPGLRRAFIAALARRRVRAALLMLTATNLGMVAVMAVAPVHMQTAGHRLAFIGVVISVHVAGMLAPSPLTGRLADRLGSGRVAAAGIGLLVVTGVIGALVDAEHGPAEAVMLGLLGLAWNAGMVGASVMLAESVPPALRPYVEGIGEAAMGTAAAAGAPLAGLVFARGGVSGVWVLTVLLAALVLPVARQRPA